MLIAHNLKPHLSPVRRYLIIGNACKVKLQGVRFLIRIFLEDSSDM